MKKSIIVLSMAILCASTVAFAAPKSQGEDELANWAFGQAGPRLDNVVVTQESGYNIITVANPRGNENGPNQPLKEIAFMSFYNMSREKVGELNLSASPAVCKYPSPPQDEKLIGVGKAVSGEKVFFTIDPNDKSTTFNRIECGSSPHAYKLLGGGCADLRTLGIVSPRKK